MNRNLVEWETGFSDQWDDRGHYTTDTEPAPYVWGMALDLTDAVTASKECFTLNWNEFDESDLIAGLFLTALSNYVEATSIAFDDVFDDTQEFNDWIESMVDTAYSSQHYEWNISKTHEILVENLPSYFGVK